ncbi:MAG TPA: transcriptional regulator [Pseudonocardiaceae bacterium]|nr:transcriptional regulator [Pseudonocardiaceae bacterium]
MPSSTTGSGQLPREVAALTGHATLRVDREAVPHLRKVFNDALAKLDVQIDLAMSGVRVSPWAGDPVSANAATDLNDHSVDGTGSALDALRAYQRQLKSASDALTQVAEEYRIVESDNSDSFRAAGG